MDREEELERMRRKYAMSVVVVDSEFEKYDIDDVRDVGMDQFNNLIVTDLEGFTVLCIAAGVWRTFETSRVPRIESTSDTPTNDGETDADPASERQPDLPRDGA